jgi:hypothetical protein
MHIEVMHHHVHEHHRVHEIVHHHVHEIMRHHRHHIIACVRGAWQGLAHPRAVQV